VAHSLEEWIAKNEASVQTTRRTRTPKATAQGSRSHSLSQPTVRVFLPDWKRADDAFYQDGVSQYAAFTEASRYAMAHSAGVEVKYEPVLNTEDASNLLARMRTGYAEGARYFIVTMSPVVELVMHEFAKWYKKQRLDPPILVATVASAPGLADSAGGILRWYVRTEEECELLAQWLAWHERARTVAIFDATGEPSFGNNARKLFSRSFVALNGTVWLPRNPKRVLKEQVAEFISDLPNLTAPDAANPKGRITGAIVVGYGTPFREALTELGRQKPFVGPIACTSTLTSSAWQPNCDDWNEDMYKRIVTVVPRLKDQDQHEKRHLDVVRFFAEHTLRRVLEIAADNSNARGFFHHWASGEHLHDTNYPKLDEEYLHNGDTVVHLEIAKDDVWRANT